MGDAPAAVGSADADRAATAERGRAGRPGAAAGRAPPPPSQRPSRCWPRPTATPRSPSCWAATGWPARSRSTAAKWSATWPGRCARTSSGGTHAWVDHAAHACADPELARDLYAASAPAWIEAGARLHLALVPATAGQMDPWYRLGLRPDAGGGHARERGVAAAAAGGHRHPPGRAGRPRAGRPRARHADLGAPAVARPTFTGLDLARLGHGCWPTGWRRSTTSRTRCSSPSAAADLLGSSLYDRPPHALGGAGRRRRGWRSSAVVPQRARPGSRAWRWRSRRSPGRARPATARS